VRIMKSTQLKNFYCIFDDGNEICFEHILVNFYFLYIIPIFLLI